MDTKQIMEAEIIDKIKKEIEAASGREIYLQAGYDFERERIIDFKILARGNKSRVPAIIYQLKPGDIVVHNHPSGNLEPSAADIQLASRIGERGVGFAIINNQVDNIYMVVEPGEPQTITRLSAEEICDLFVPGGELEQKLEDYEYRKQQLEVVKQVIESFNNKEHSFIEAGTGTGKSFAYLIPALFWNHVNEQPVVVSTNTINLQEQLIHKDLVFLEQILPFTFSTVLVKGRGNYVCLRKIKTMEDKADDIFDDSQKRVQFMKLLNWLEKTKNGSRADINFLVENEIWDRIVSETELCINTKCPFFDSCFFMKARREVFSADLLVVNHHLLLSDASLKQENRGFLPDYKNLIVDEAHNFESVATYHLGKPFNSKLLEKYLNKIDDSRFSLIVRLRKEIGALEVENKKEILGLIDKTLAQVKRIRESSSQYFETLQDFYGDQAEGMMRLTREVKEEEQWVTVTDRADNLIGNLKKINYYLDSLLKEMDFSDDIENRNEQETSIKERILELESLIQKCQSIIKALDFNLTAADDNFVFWLERDNSRRQQKIQQKNAPLDISMLLPEILWQKLNNTVITSATLTVNDSFSFFKESLGISGAATFQVASPFDFKKQARLLIPEDIPSPRDDSFLDDILDHFRKMLINFGGATMVLFTSYSMLNYCLQNTRNQIRAAGINILAQGEHPRHYIIENFKKNNKQVIFGTVSFWEGVDVKGDDLQYLLIMKLPFPVPGRPVAQARQELLRQRGENPFFKYSLPRAVIRFKQGFGRLIRSRSDKGVVISFDRRLLTRSYGKIFLNSLPADCPIEKKMLKELCSIKI